MKFNYQAKTTSGSTQSGVVETSSREAALSLLQSYGLFVISLKEEKESASGLDQIAWFQKVSRKDLVLFFRQLAILFKSNVPVVESLRTIAKQVTKQSFRDKIIAISERVEGGVPLSRSLAIYPKVFSPFYISVIKSGEMSGKLSDVLGYLADHIEDEYNFYSKITAAMVYPIFVLVVFLAILMVMSIFVVPQLTGILLETGQDLPVMTKIVISFSNFLKDFWWVVLVIVAGMVAFVNQFIKGKEGKEFVDRLLLRTPFLGDFFKKVNLARIAENLSTLISAGFPIIQALETTGDIVTNTLYKQVIFDTGEGVRKGETISSYLSKYPILFSPMFIQMLVIGEKTGQIDLTLLNIVNYYQKEVERSLDGFIKMLEPIMIIVLGVGVAFFMASILLPLYSINFT